jgi:predicted phosphodiesterase
MLTAIFSDIHGNLPALETFIRATQGKADNYVCLGDVVNYGPWNDECLELVSKLPGIVTLMGNHERLFLKEEPLDHEIPLVQEFYKQSIQYFTREAFIKGFVESYELGNFLCVHTIDNLRIYPDTVVDVSRNYFIGHTHHQFRNQFGEYTVINVGSVGQNRKYIDTLNYVLYNTKTGECQLCEAIYPFDTFLEEIIHRGYPLECINYYRAKARKGSVG